MNNIVKTHQPEFAENNRKFVIYSLALALYSITLLWGFWSQGYEALGFNFSLFALGVCFTFCELTKTKRLFSEENLIWVVPTLTIALSYSLYDNPYIKVFNFFVFPLVFGCLFLYSQLKNKDSLIWSFSFVLISSFRSSVCLLGQISNSCSIIKGQLAKSSPEKASLVKRIALGLLALTVLSIAVVVPLLSYADADFAKYTKDFYKFLEDYFSISELFQRTLAFLVGAIAILSAGLLWSQEWEASNRSLKPLDSIVSGIVIGGIFLIYLVFLFLQIEKIYVGTLPINFVDAEALVKHGFWQLLVLTFLNIIMVVTCLKRTNAFVERLLQAFTVASFLLLASAAYRMGLYIVFYGLSYEKFFACYTVLYCGLMLGFLSIASLVKEFLDPIRFGALLFAGMYSFATILPVEHVIMETNMQLVKREDSRMALFDMKMLSTDILPLVERYQIEGAFLKDPRAQKLNNELKEKYTNWNKWIECRRYNISEKSIHELNLLNVIYLLRNDQEIPKPKQHCYYGYF